MLIRPLMVLVLPLALASPAFAEAPRVDGGVVSLNKWEQPDFARMSQGGGDRYYVVEVPLSRPWSAPPLVMTSLSAIDGDNSANLRIAVGVGRVGPRSFELRIRTWAETRIWGVAVSWVALEAPGVVQPTLPMVNAGLATPPPPPPPHDQRVLALPPPPPPLDRAKARPWARCRGGEAWGCQPITTGVAPPRGEDNPSVCGCVPACGLGSYLFTRPTDGTWPDGSPRGSFSCTTSLPP